MPYFWVTNQPRTDIVYKRTHNRACQLCNTILFRAILTIKCLLSFPGQNFTRSIVTQKIVYQSKSQTCRLNKTWKSSLINHSSRQAISHSCTNHFHNTTIFCENSLTSQYFVVVHGYYMLTQIMIPVVHVETVVDIKPKFLIALERKDKSVFRTKISLSYYMLLFCYKAQSSDIEC